MKKIIIIAILIIAQNQLMAQAKKEIADDQNAAVVAKFEKENKAILEKVKKEEADYQIRMKAIENKSYIVPVPENLKHKNKKPLDKSSATGAPASSATRSTSLKK
jgi:CRISPR/Cas system-associated endonuclease Cas3-HD